MSKRILYMFMTLFIVVLFSSCGSVDSENSENISQTAKSSDKEKIQQTETEINTEESEDEPEENSYGSQVAVVYFSATGTTAEIAKMITDETESDLFEIVPQIPYSSDDLNYNDDNCRANMEQNDDSARPEISNDLSLVESYDTVYLGYPVWWGTVPRIIQTFIENYDLSDATVYTFCTSGGSGIEKSISDLQTMYPDVNIVSGKRLNDATADDIHSWIEELK
jgi:flavodoxin